MYRNETRIRVRYKETDAMGIAYHANYFVWFEIGRTEWMRALGLPYRDLEKSGIYLPVIKASCEYRSAARYDDELTIITLLESLRAVRISFLYEIRCGERLLARGSTEHAFVDERGRPVALRKKNPFLWRKLCQVLEGRHGS
ncbi:MAG: acyl-CoA thioesterase [Firmicutes bacterium]|jgi:acyl-CoA thioester hydrolase|nr:acyl-CoA thioesterase [Bacillota bacterium]HPU01660.1 thioesterase family protein [Bacillota bacterium]